MIHERNIKDNILNIIDNRVIEVAKNKAKSKEDLKKDSELIITTLKVVNDTNTVKAIRACNKLCWKIGHEELAKAEIEMQVITLIRDKLTLAEADLQQVLNAKEGMLKNLDFLNELVNLYRVFKISLLVDGKEMLSSEDALFPSLSSNTTVGLVIYFILNGFLEHHTELAKSFL